MNRRTFLKSTIAFLLGIKTIDKLLTPKSLEYSWKSITADQIELHWYEHTKIAEERINIGDALYFNNDGTLRRVNGKQ